MERRVTQWLCALLVFALVTGDRQGTLVGHALAEPLAVRVCETGDVPVAGARVAWTVTFGSGSLSADTTTSLSSGLSQVVFTAGADPGVSRVRATVVGTTATVAFAVVAGRDNPFWPNEPAGFKVLSDESFDALNEHGWLEEQRETIDSGLGVLLMADPLAPRSPPGVLAFAYPVGFVGGREPGVAFFRPAAPVAETYFAFWWRPSDPWQSHMGNTNKIAFMFPLTGAQGDIFIMMYNTPVGHTIQVEPEFPIDTRRMEPNVAATPVTLGEWHLIEWYVKYATTDTTRDGATRWWLDGVLQGRYTDLQTPPGDPGFIEYQLAPTWGGLDDVKSEADTFWFDHAHLSRP